VSSTDEAAQAPGWDAIDRALRPIYGDMEPLHWGTLYRWRLGGPDPLDGVSAYPRVDPVPHWHYVGYGLSDLYEKESDDPEVSGWGFELTFRLARDPAETEAPAWAAQFLQNLARYVFQTGNDFAAGDVIDASDPHSEIRAAAFTADPELGEITTPHGRVRFLQAIVLTPDEYTAAWEWDTTALLEVLAPRLPLFVSDLDRGSLLDDPAIATAVRTGSARDGSSTGAVRADSLACTYDDGTVQLRLSIEDAPRVARMLAARLPYGRPLLVMATPERGVQFLPGDRFTITPGDIGEITVPPDAVDALLEVLRAPEGVHTSPSLPGLSTELAAHDFDEPDEPDEFDDPDDWPVRPPGDRVFGLVEPDLGEGVCADTMPRRDNWSIDLFYGDPLSLHGPFVWVRTANPAAAPEERSLSLMLLSEHRRLVEHAWLGDHEPAVAPEPAEVRLVVGSRQLTADALIEGDLAWVQRAELEDASVVTVIGRGIDVDRVRLAPIGDLDPYYDRRSELYDRLSAALHNRPDPPNPALEGNALEALRAVIKRIDPYTIDEIVAGNVDRSNEPLPPPPPNRETLTGLDGHTVTREYEQAVRELQRANDVDRETAESWVGAATEQVYSFNEESFFDQNPDLYERACEETLRYYAYDEKVASRRAQNAWDAWREHYFLLDFVLDEKDDFLAYMDRQGELRDAWRAEWRAWVAAQSVGE
jgi:suppressor of fused